MKSRLLWFVSIATLIFSTALAAPSKSSGSSGGTVHVNGYTRKDGTYVAPHERTAPNSTKNDNWSTKGNVNPYTGKAGTKPVDSSSVTAPTTTPSATPVSTGSPSTESAYVTGYFHPQKPATASASVIPLSAVMMGMTKAQVIAQVGEPNIKTETSWFYMDRGWVKFKAGSVVTGVEAK